MTAVIRRARSGDCIALSRLAETTFRETFVDGFGIPYPPSDLAEFLAGACSARAFGAMLAAPGLAVWAAEDGEDLVAYATAGPCVLPHPDAKPWDGELKRLYIARGRQGQGLGRAMLRTVLDWLEERGEVQWVGVWSENHRAQRLYTDAGFEKVGEYDFPVGRHLDREFILRRVSG